MARRFRSAAVEALWGEIATVVRLIEREFSGKAASCTSLHPADDLTAR
jgi:hypothetical protein